MIIYRIEDAQQVGPYHDMAPEDCDTTIGEYATNQDGHTSRDSAHPTPRQDALLRPHYNHLVNAEYACGFSNISQLLSWFGPKARAYLATRGYSLLALDVPSDAVHHGTHQCMFRRSAARTVRTLSLESP